MATYQRSYRLTIEKHIAYAHRALWKARQECETCTAFWSLGEDLEQILVVLAALQEQLLLLP